MATRILRLKLKNFVGIDKGLGLKELEIDFSKTDHRLILLLGGNGKGKTTIQSTLHPFSGTFDVRNSSFILEGKDGLKEIDIQQDDRIYHIVHSYSDKKNKSFIKRIDADGTETELNAAGTVRSFVPIIQEELGLTEEFFKLIKVGSQTENFIDLESSKRKDFIGKFTPDISPYLDAFKVVSGKYTASNRDIRFLADELSKLETRDTVSKGIGIARSSLGNLKDKLASQQGEVAVLESKLADSQDVIEENQELSEKRNELSAVIQESEDSIAEINEIYKGNLLKEDDTAVEVKTLLTSYEGKLSATQDELSTARVEYATASQEISTLTDNISRNRKEIENLTSGSEGNSRELKARVVSLTSDFETISKGRFSIEGFSELYENADVTNSSVQLTTAKSAVDNLISFRNVNEPSNLSEMVELYTPSSVNDLVSVIDSNIESIEKKVKACEAKKKQLEGELTTLEQESYAAKAASDLLQYCSKGTECCLYKKVTELNEGTSSQQLHHDLETEIAVASKQLRTYSTNIDSQVEVRRYAERLMNQKMGDEVSKGLLDFINEVSETEFTTVADALLYINSDILSNYSTTIDREISRLKVMTRLKTIVDSIERSKRSLSKFSASEGTIALLESNISEDNKKVVVVKERVSETRDLVASLTATEKRYQSIITRINTVLDSFNKIAVASKELVTVTKRISKLEKTASEALQNADILKDIQREIKVTKSEIETVEDDLNRKRLALTRIDEFVTRKDKLEIDRKRYGVIKDSLDIRLGIPLVLVGDYLNDIRDTTNALLDVVFRGKFYIDFDISDKSFAVPVYNNGVCTAGDILLCSQGEVSLVKTSLSLGIVIQAISSMANQYNVVQLDEIDAQLDSSYRMTFLQMLDKQLDALSSKQCFVITHNDCFFSSDAGLIILPGHTADITDEEFMSNKDIVADFS